MAEAQPHRSAPTATSSGGSFEASRRSGLVGIIKENAQGLVDLGLAEKGYDIVTTDCGWPSTNRTADGRITWNSTLFPSGFPALGEYIHDLGLQFGLYSGAGRWQCNTDPEHIFLVASLGYETEDAQSFAEWGGDALKYDNCWANETEDTHPLLNSISPS
ncbi:Alpha-galactosidase precursor [Lasiodiplodia theobromae]|uniref:Alpha-galactosidase precursor n=1 Tax=Lasiodiplodia theobromae TaxID=45133 RepID=UPI0015C40DDA|nr:Alpha-galactosidase precursor [Lasiodiplodia theobromae]KAF4535470.1 Alpha-galactosidase precursor [Lasiodiplodia theobromae]